MDCFCQDDWSDACQGSSYKTYSCMVAEREALLVVKQFRVKSMIFHVPVPSWLYDQGRASSASPLLGVRPGMGNASFSFFPSNRTLTASPRNRGGKTLFGTPALHRGGPTDRPGGLPWLPSGRWGGVTSSDCFFDPEPSVLNMQCVTSALPVRYQCVTQCVTPFLTQNKANLWFSS